jgi:hypothetical protein
VKRLALTLGITAAVAAVLVLIRRAGEGQQETWTPVEPS